MIVVVVAVNFCEMHDLVRCHNMLSDCRAMTATFMMRDKQAREHHLSTQSHFINNIDTLQQHHYNSVILITYYRIASKLTNNTCEKEAASCIA